MKLHKKVFKIGIAASRLKIAKVRSKFAKIFEIIQAYDDKKLENCKKDLIQARAII